jgi:predicted transcriptional regulator
MTEDLSRWVEYSPDGSPKVKRGIGALPPMRKSTATPRPSDKEPASKANTPKRKTTDRFRLLNEFVDCSLVGLSRVELGTWLVLYRDARDGTARTAQNDIARRLGVTDRAIKYAVGRLIRLGLVTLVYRGGLNRGTNRYRVEPAARCESKNNKAPPG